MSNMVSVNGNDLRALIQSSELLMDLFNRKTIGGHGDYVAGFVHASMQKKPEKDDGQYGDGYAAGLVVQEARSFAKSYRTQYRIPEVQKVDPVLTRKEGMDSKLTTPQERRDLARVQGFTGSFCNNCQGAKMRRNGTCELCADCGTTNGCS